MLVHQRVTTKNNLFQSSIKRSSPSRCWHPWAGYWPVVLRPSTLWMLGLRNVDLTRGKWEKYLICPGQHVDLPSIMKTTNKCLKLGKQGG